MTSGYSSKSGDILSFCSALAAGTCNLLSCVTAPTTVILVDCCQRRWASPPADLEDGDRSGDDASDADEAEAIVVAALGDAAYPEIALGD
jgi:hypothetical protein